MTGDPRMPDGPYDPQPRPDTPDVAPVTPGHTPQEVPLGQPSEVPSIDPGRAPPSYDPGPALPESPGMPTDPQQPRA